MKHIVYITNKKVWFDTASFDWEGSGLTEIFKANKQKINFGDVRIVLGNEVSYVSAFLQKNVDSLTRENVEIEIRNHVPIAIDNDCFDWKSTTVRDETWIQFVAVEKELLDNISRAVKESGVKVNLMTPIGVLLGQKSILGKAPMIVKWTGMETLSVLAISGLTDSVYSETSDKQIVDFARNKWELSADPEILTLDDSSFNLNEEIFKEKNKGNDAEVLSIPIVRNLEPITDKKELVTPDVAGESADAPGDIVIEGKSKRGKKKWLIGLLVLAIILVMGIGGWLLLGREKTESKLPVAEIENAVPSPLPTATPSAAIDFSKYSIQVLNGSGENGVAAGIRDSLIAAGFVTVDTGNAPATTSGTIQSKATLPVEVSIKAKEIMATYVINDTNILTSDNKYDLVIVVGSEKN